MNMENEIKEEIRDELPKFWIKFLKRRIDDIKEMKWYRHLATINNHKRLVMDGCFKVGLYYQGLMHDLSKYSWTEFSVGAKYFQGTRSPNEAEREEKGYTSSWLHHKGRNKHHLEYWMDYSADRSKGFIGMPMPDNYIVEMFIDRIAASKNYLKENYYDKAAWDYYKNGRAKKLLHPDTKRKLEHLMKMLAVKGEDYTFAYCKRWMRWWKAKQIMKFFKLI